MYNLQTSIIFFKKGHLAKSDRVIDRHHPQSNFFESIFRFPLIAKKMCWGRDWSLTNISYQKAFPMYF